MGKYYSCCEEERGGPTLDDLPGLLVDVPALADDGHHGLNLGDVVGCAMLLLERLPDLQQRDTLQHTLRPVIHGRRKKGLPRSSGPSS
jgi:hypothetical protein